MKPPTATKRPTPKPRSPKANPRRHRASGAAWLANPGLLVEISDEIDLIDNMLRCVPDLGLASQMVRDGESRDVADDPIRYWIKNYGGERKLKELKSQDYSGSSMRDILGSSDAMVDTARWRLERLRTLFEVLRHPVKQTASKTLGGR